MADILLYHGPTRDSADALIASGWEPNAWAADGNRGQHRFLYLTNLPENALWFAQEKGGDVVVEVVVPEKFLAVDPEVGVPLE